MKLAIPGPNVTATTVPIIAKMATIEIPKNMASKRDFRLDLLPCIKKETVMGIIGKTQGVSNAINPLPKAIQKSFQRFREGFDVTAELSDTAGLTAADSFF